MNCSACGSSVGRDDKFCRECGRPQDPQVADALAAERRPLTIMFVDLVGSTELSGAVDPEEFRDVISAYYEICADAIGRYDGHVVKYMGDGAMVYFGYPVAHEDDPRRAVHAALEIAHDVPLLQRRLPAEVRSSINARIGIHTGLTIVGEHGSGLARESLAVGATPNVAARLENVAGSGDVVISDATHASVETSFTFDDLGPLQLKGVAQPVRGYRVTGVIDRPATVLGRGRMVGRRRELDLIVAAAQRLTGHASAAVMVEGQPGLGKSRLVDAVRRQLAPMRLRWAVASCSPFHENSSLFAFAAIVERLAGIEPGDTATARLRKLGDLLARCGIDRPDAQPLLARLTAVDQPDQLIEYPPQVVKQRTFLLLREILCAAADEPLVVVIEDLHWADPSTIELVHDACTLPLDAPVLLLMTARPTSRIADVRNAATAVRLRSLDPDEMRELIVELAGPNRPPQDVVDLIALRSDGVPLFAEELIRATWRDRAKAAPAVDAVDRIPVTLQGSLAAQLDRLGPTKRLVQHASTLGREFRADLLRAITPDSVDVERGLEQLVAADILIASSESGQVYEFRHALIRDAAYDSMLRRTSRRLHAEVARAYEAQFVVESSAHPELVAEHWRRAGNDRAAARHFNRAGRRFVRVDANEEALAAYSRGVQCLRDVLAEYELFDELPPDASEVEAELVELLTEQGRLLGLAGNRESAEASFRSAMEFAHDRVAMASLHRQVGTTHEQDRPRALAAFDAAEQALGPPDDHLRWRQEWLQVAFARLGMHYWFDDTDEMERLITRIKPFVDTHATHHQRAEFYEQITLTELRREHYLISDAACDHVRSFVAGAELAGDVSQLAEAWFLSGFCRAIGRDGVAAVDELNRALVLARRCGHQTIEVRCLAYLAVASRLVGAVAETEQHSSLARAKSIEAGMVEYVALADANDAWVALQRGDLETGRRLAEAADAEWSSMSMVWPFRWFALLPMLSIGVARSDVAMVVGAVERLLSPSQQRLPDSFVALLERVIQQRDETVETIIATAGAAIVEAARSGMRP